MFSRNKIEHLDDITTQRVKSRVIQSHFVCWLCFSSWCCALVRVVVVVIYYDIFYRAAKWAFSCLRAYVNFLLWVKPEARSLVYASAYYQLENALVELFFLKSYCFPPLTRRCCCCWLRRHCCCWLLSHSSGHRLERNMIHITTNNNNNSNRKATSTRYKSREREIKSDSKTKTKHFSFNDY